MAFLSDYMQFKSQQLKTELDSEKQKKDKIKEHADGLATLYRNAEVGVHFFTSFTVIIIHEVVIHLQLEVCLRTVEPE